MTDVRVHNVAGGAFQRFVGDRVVLRPVMPSDLPFLYEIANSDKNAFRWRFRGALPSMEQFEADVNQASYQHLVALDKESGALVGYVSAYAYDPSNAVCSVAVLMAESAVGQRLGREAMELFITHLFRASPLRKIYAEVPGMTFDGVEESATNEGLDKRFVIEGRLVDHWWSDGRFVDKIIVAIYREQWQAG